MSNEKIIGSINKIAEFFLKYNYKEINHVCKNGVEVEIVKNRNREEKLIHKACQELEDQLIDVSYDFENIFGFGINEVKFQTCATKEDADNSKLKKIRLGECDIMEYADDGEKEEGV